MQSSKALPSKQTFMSSPNIMCTVLNLCSSQCHLEEAGQLKSEGGEEHQSLWGSFQHQDADLEHFFLQMFALILKTTLEMWKCTKMGFCMFG